MNNHIVIVTGIVEPTAPTSNLPRFRIVTSEEDIFEQYFKLEGGWDMKTGDLVQATGKIIGIEGGEIVIAVSDLIILVAHPTSERRKPTAANGGSE